MKKIVVLAVLLFGLLLTSTIGVSTAAAKQPKENAVVIAPPGWWELPNGKLRPGRENQGEIRACVCVPQKAIDRSPAIQPLEQPD